MVDFPLPARAWMTCTGASDAAIAVRMSCCSWSMICKAGGKSSKKPSYNILRKQFLEIRSLAGPVISKAARMGAHSEASVFLSVMNVVMAGPA